MRQVYTLTLSLCIFIFTFYISNELVEKSSFKENDERGTSGALAALDFWTQSRAYPDKIVPASKYFQAYQTSKSKIKEVSTLASAGSTWDPIGPLNLQGRSKSVALNPQNPSTVYVGTASGGLWRSYTGGLGGDWQQVKLGYPALGITAIVINPSDSNTIYIGTGEVYRYANALGGLAVRTTRGSYGIGILKTTDGGKNWSKSLDWSYSDESGIQALKMNPLNPNTVYAATTEGIFKTMDAGATWEQMLLAFMAEDVVVNSADTNQVLCTIGNFSTGSAFVSTDGGGTWNSSPLPSYSGKAILAMYPIHPNVVFASAANDTTGVAALYRSTNFGGSWTKLRQYSSSNGLYGVQGWYSHYVAVHPQDSSIIIVNAVGRSKSTDGGRSFYGVGTGYSDNHSYAIHPTDPNIIYVVNDDGIYRSTDFGDSYENIGFGLQSGQIYNGFSCSSTDSLLALAQSQDHIPGYRYLGSPIWDHGSANDEAGWTATDQSNDNIMYAVNRFGGAVFKSINRGNTFGLSASFGGIGAWNSPIVVSHSNTNVIYFGDGIVYKSTDAGADWIKTNNGNYIDGNPVLSMAVSFSSPETVYVGTVPIKTSAHIFRTTNGGMIWTNITGPLPNRYPIDIAVDPTNSRIVYVAYGGFGGQHLFKSINSGTTWTDISTALPDIPTTAIAVDPLHPEVIYAGNDIGVYASTNGGNSWTSFNSGLPDAVIVADLVISPSNRTLRIATHGNGVWERKLLFELSNNYFDYKALSINSPIDGASFNLGSAVTPLRATFSNLSAQAQTDSFNVKFRILYDGIEVFSSTKRIAGLGYTETRVVTFEGDYTPGSDGTYIVQAITLAPDNAPSNDTTQSIFNVITPSTVSHWRVNKLYSPYAELIGGTIGAFGDDGTSKTQIPFSFMYDNHLYNKVQISTNGWMELGAGTDGYLLGLSTNTQLGGFFKPSLATTDHPTKVLGPWWTDLAADSGQITYSTIGSAPNRVFIVQWKNVPAYCCDPANSIFLNFQVKLYETYNLIEFCYGPVFSSIHYTFMGASIGLKDYAGGDYRYYDIARRSSGLASELRNNLSPLTDWPGADSVYQIHTNISDDVKEIKTAQLPTEFSLHQNYPNPFNPLTVIRYQLPSDNLVTLKTYNMIGQEIATLINGKQAAGYYEATWDARQVPSGVYLYKLQAGNYTETKKMLLLK